VLLHAGAGYGPSKRWAEENWARLAEGVKGEFGAQPAFIGAPPDAETVARVRRFYRTELVDLTSCGIDLHLLKPVVGACSLLVTTDSGPRHYGVALGVPTVCLMGPTHPDYSTSGLPHDRVVRVDVECGPCQKKTCRTDHRCMTLLTPQMVLEACRPALEAAGGAKR
jgi:heptosyltransferase-2